MKSGTAYFLRCLSFLAGISAAAMLVPLMLAAAFGEREMIFAFAFPSGLVLCVVLPVMFFTRKSEAGIDTSKGLLLVCLGWFLSCLIGALPFYLSASPLAGGQAIRFADAFFESSSGFSTTGATIFIEVESLPRSLLFWRSLTQWLGGMGMVVLTVALAPLFGSGGFQLFMAEAPGPDKGKITPRISSNARILWLLYVSLTILQTLLLIPGGMNWFDALIHAFSTVATGGFSARSSSIASYNSPWIEWVCIVFMIIAGFNFNLIYRLLRGKGREVFKNSEARAYAGIILTAGTICACLLFRRFQNGAVSLAGALEQSARKALFQCVSILTTTGFSAADHRLWHPLATGVLFFLMFIGGCSSSTGGGIKVIRHVILFKQTRNELMKQLNPRGVFSIQINGKEGQKNIVHGVAGFIFLYLALVTIASLFVSYDGVDIFSSLNIGLLLTGNIGLGIVQGSMENVLYELSSHVKWILSFAMIAGRLELWAIFALFHRRRN